MAVPVRYHQRILPFKESVMKFRYWNSLPLVFLLIVALPTQAQHAHEGHADPGTHAATTPIPATRYATDAPLREGMARIHAALDELAHYEMGHMPQSLAVERVEEIKSAVDFLFANCKLDATADVALHGMLAPLLGAIQTFKAKPEDASAVAAMRSAVADYPRVFDDPAWPLQTEEAADHEH